MFRRWHRWGRHKFRWSKLGRLENLLRTEVLKVQLFDKTAYSIIPIANNAPYQIVIFFIWITWSKYFQLFQRHNHWSCHRHHVRHLSASMWGVGYRQQQNREHCNSYISVRLTAVTVTVTRYRGHVTVTVTRYSGADSCNGYTVHFSGPFRWECSLGRVLTTVHP